MAEKHIYTEEENALLDWAIDVIIQKYLEAGGDKAQMMTRETIDLFFCGMLYREGAEAIKNFVNNYSYTPKPKQSRGYA